jgi:bleomycin hydrolase
MRTTYWMLILVLAALAPGTAMAQVERRDRAVYVQPRNEFLDSVKAESQRYQGKDSHPKKQFTLDFKGLKSPASVEEFTVCWHGKPVSQGISGMCWCFSTTSFFESEVYRLTKREIKLSELYTVYWEYVEKARGFVRTRGESVFGEGSEANAVARIWKKYGVVPADAYTGLKPGQKYHDHGGMFKEMRDYLSSVKNMNAWNEEEVAGTIQSIMNHHMGEPPAIIVVEGKKMSPKEYLDKVLRLNLDDYVEFMSLMEYPYYRKAEYRVPDNWWHSSDYYNVPLDDFMGLVRKAIRKGYTLCIGGDTSEPGYEGHAGVAVVPTFDIPSDFIDENARQFRFSNGTTGDDHGIHIVGYAEKDTKDWYLIKDSGSGSRNNTHPGYYFYHEDYVRLKIMGITVHKDVAGELLKKCQVP